MDSHEGVGVTGAKAWVSAHRKLIVAAVGAALTVSIAVWGTDNHWVSLAILAATTFGVYQAPNSSRPGSNADSAGAGTPAK